MDEPFYYLGPGDRVPRDAVHVIIGGSVTIVPPRAFLGYQNLKKVELQEGVQEIGAGAFQGCINLERVECPSSLRTIGHYAFASCEKLSEVTLRERVEGIGNSAFLGCDLERITIPSSVVEISASAFAWCERLSEVNLTEGLRRIGAEAFHYCDVLEQIAVPSSVVEIGEEAFAGCDLEAATLTGGTVTVARGAFVCLRLRGIAIPSRAILVEAGEDGNGRAAAVTGWIERDPDNQFPQLILASPHLVLMRLEELGNLRDAIADLTRGVALNLADGNVSGRIRDCFADHLSRWYRRYKREVATILELGLWKIELGRARDASRRGADVPTRDDCRRTCGADPIVGLVLSSLAGPHRRADQGDNAGSTQPRGRRMRIAS